MSRLNTEQAAAVAMVVERRPRLCLLTGGPGCGKTYTIGEILERLQEQGRTFVLCAPSGKAAQRMTEATGAEAATIHRLLRLHPGATEPTPVEADVVIVDESSMVDVELMACLLRACREGAVQTVVLVGDPHQLPPVGPGSPFHDMVAAPQRVPQVMLTEVHRNSGELPLVAKDIREGRLPKWGEAFRLIEHEEAKAIPEAVRALVASERMEAFDHMVLAPQRRGACGVWALNEHLEETREGVADPQIVHRRENNLRAIFRHGTKVIHTKNDYGLGVFNGETGYVESLHEGRTAEGKLDPRNDHAVVALQGAGSWRKVEYRGAQLKMLSPAWALTVHKSQGSEARDVIVVAHKAHHFMLTRSLLYVACTRARSRVFVVGQEEAVAKAIAQVKDTTRNTYLRRLLSA